MQIKLHRAVLTTVICLLASASNIALGATDTYYTPSAADGSFENAAGHTYYLSSHRPNCEAVGNDRGLSGFQLERPTSSSYRYRYSCSTIPAHGAATQKTTALNDGGSGSTLFLDRHKADCEGRAILGVGLVYNLMAGIMQYAYTCGTDKLVPTDQIKTTQLDSDAGGHTMFLDRHNVSCDTGDVLSYVALKRNASTNQYQYEYKCQSPVPEPTEYYSDGTSDGKFGSALYLRHHFPDCSTTSATLGLNRFQLERNSSNQYRYNYGCAAINGAPYPAIDTWTVPNDHDNGNVIWLDRHALNCNGKPILNFRLLWQSSKEKVLYTYKCGANTLSGAPVTRHTAYTPSGLGNATFLEQQNVACEPGELMSAFKLQNGTGVYRYEYICHQP